MTLWLFISAVYLAKEESLRLNTDGFNHLEVVATCIAVALIAPILAVWDIIAWILKWERER